MGVQKHSKQLRYKIFTEWKRLALFGEETTCKAAIEHHCCVMLTWNKRKLGETEEDCPLSQLSVQNSLGITEEMKGLK